MKGIALYPGAFKPPTRGHFLLVKSLLDNSYIAADVDRETGDFTRPEEKPEVTGVNIFIGTQERSGITQEISKQIWDIYSKYLKGNIEIKASDRNPVADVYSLLKHNPDTPFFPVVGYRDASDMADLKRFDDAKKRYPNMTILTVYSEPEDTTRATNLRKAIIDGNDKEAAKFLPAELNAEDLEAVINLLKSTVTIEERMNYSIEQVMLGLLTEEVEEVEEVTMGTPVAPIAVLPSEERQRMQNLTAYFQKLAPDDVIVDFNGQSIVITPMLYNKTVPGDYTPEQKPIEEYQDTAAAINYVPYIASILEYMVKKGMTVMPLPEIVTREDQENAANVFGRTAYYEPAEKKLVLYVTGRHPKDVLRSFCHEMIHHMQNLEGRLPFITTTNTQEDSALNEIEKEAHFLGSMIMREWEDSVKNEYNDPQDGKAAPYGSGYNPVNENALANIIAKLAAPLISLIISRAIDGLFGYIDDIKNIVAPEPYIKFLKGLEKNDEFNKQFIQLAIQREKEKNPALGSEWRELTTNLPAFKEAFDKFAEEEGIEGSNKSYLLSKVSITMWDTYLKTWKEIHQVLKKKYPDLTQDLKEGTKYRSIVADVRQAVNIALNTLLSGKKLKGYNIKTRREPSKKDRELAEKIGMTPLGVMFHNEYQTAYLGSFESKSEKGTPTKVEVSLKFALTDEVKPGKYHIDGEAGSDEGEIDIILAFNPEDGTNMLQAIQSQLTDLIRHETEHLTQSGDQVKPTKWMRGDQARRREIRKNPEIWHKYYMLPKEVDANIQGLYAKSKYEKKDFQSVVDAYLDDLVNTDIVTVGNKQKIYDLWKARIPQIGGIPNLK